MNPDLDKLSDDELSDVFAREVAQLIKCDKWVPAYHPLAGVQKGDCGHENCHPVQFWPPKFATSADAVLPWLPKHWKVEAGILYDTGPDNKIIAYRDTVIVKVKDGKASAPTFARAACLALIRAKRAQKEAAP